MPSELPPEEDRSGVPIAPPLLFVLPIIAAFALVVPTSLLHRACRWILGAIFFLAGVALKIAGFVTQKRGHRPDSVQSQHTHRRTRAVSF